MTKWLHILLATGLGLIGSGELLAQTASITCAEAARTLIDGADLDPGDGKGRILSSSEINWSTHEGHKGVCRLDGQGRVYLVEVTQFPAPAVAEYNLTCKSSNYKRTECAMRGPGTARLTRQLSQSRCIENSSWGVDGSKLWVDKGCGAQFAIKPAPTWATYSQTCESRNGRRETCRLKGQAEVILMRQLSSDPCRRDSTWGVNRDTIWVDRGCRGQFRISPVGHGDTGVVDNRTAALRACRNEAAANHLDVVSDRVIEAGPRYIDVRLVTRRSGISMDMMCRYDIRTREARISGT